jgi:hypothetical protein
MDRVGAIRTGLSDQVHLDDEVTIVRGPDGIELAPSRNLVHFSYGGTIDPGASGRLR